MSVRKKTNFNRLRTKSKNRSKSGKKTMEVTPKFRQVIPTTNKNLSQNLNQSLSQILKKTRNCSHRSKKCLQHGHQFFQTTTSPKMRLSRIQSLQLLKLFTKPLAAFSSSENICTFYFPIIK